jgi:hypothetical protein
VEHLICLNSKGIPLAVASNIRLGGWWLTVTNTLAYYGVVFIVEVKGLIVAATLDGINDISKNSDDHKNSISNVPFSTLNHRH